MRIPFKDLLESVENLSPSQLQQLYVLVCQRRALSKGTETNADSLLLYQALSNELAGSTPLLSYHRLPKNWKNTYETVAGSIREWARASLGEKSSRQFRSAFYLLVARLVAKEVKSYSGGIPLQARLLVQLRNAPSLVEAQFPGYAEAGLLEKILKGV